MNYSDFKKLVFDYSKELGCDCAELYYSNRKSTDINVLEGAIDQFNVSSYGGANLRVTFSGKNGYAFTQEFSDPKTLVSRAIDNAKVIENTDERPMLGACDYQDISYPASPASSMSDEEMINYALDLEVCAKNSDERFQRVSNCSVQKDTTSVQLSNTNGLDAKYQTHSCAIVIGAILKEGEEVEESYAFRLNEDFLDKQACVDDAIAQTVSKFGASAVNSGKYNIIIANKAASTLLSAFSPLFSAEVVQNKMSLLEGKEGEFIASPCVNITDDGLFHKNPTPFDGEGTPSQTTRVIEGGVLKTFLHDTKTALKSNCKSTGNAGRSSEGGTVKVKCTNFILEEGEKSFNDLVEEMQDGLVISGLAGAHAGVSTISGDFSLIAQGYLVKNGKKVQAVKQITIAGNFLTLLKSVKAIANDSYLNPFGSGRTISPSFLVEDVMVSGL